MAFISCQSIKDITPCLQKSLNKQQMNCIFIQYFSMVAFGFSPMQAEIGELLFESPKGRDGPCDERTSPKDNINLIYLSI